MPISGPVDFEAFKSKALWIEVNTRAGTAAGQYLGQVCVCVFVTSELICVKITVGSITIPLQVNVLNYRLPKYTSPLRVFEVN